MVLGFLFARRCNEAELSFVAPAMGYRCPFPDNSPWDHGGSWGPLGPCGSMGTCAPDGLNRRPPPQPRAFRVMTKPPTVRRDRLERGPGVERLQNASAIAQRARFFATPFRRLASCRSWRAEELRNSHAVAEAERPRSATMNDSSRYCVVVVCGAARAHVWAGLVVSQKRPATPRAARCSSTADADALAGHGRCGGRPRLAPTARAARRPAPYGARPGPPGRPTDGAPLVPCAWHICRRPNLACDVSMAGPTFGRLATCCTLM